MDTLDTLINRIKSISDDPVIQKLAIELTNWKDSQDNVKQLESTIERFIGNTWINEDHQHEQVYQIWLDFKNDNIRVIQGMTMNERLFSFGLMQKFDSSRSSSDQDLIYKKLLASR